MKRGVVMRRIAAVILICFTAVIAVIAVPLFYGLSRDDATRLAAGVFASEADTIYIRQPIQLSARPRIILASAMVIAQGAPLTAGRSLKLIAPVFEIALGATALLPNDMTAAAGWLIAPLLEPSATAGIDAVTLQDAVIKVTYDNGQTFSVQSLDAQIKRKGGTGFAAKGKFVFRDAPVAFETTSAPSAATASDAPDDRAQPPPRPLHLRLTSALGDATLDGALELGAQPRLSARTSIRVADASSFATWLGIGWRRTGAGPALQISGPAIWTSDAVSFGKSQVTLNEQPGVGVVSIRLRDARPLIEATLAFPVLDVAPLLAAVTTLRPQASDDPVDWLSLASDFPALAALDADWRLSAEKIQWHGKTIGRTALSVSARAGTLHADFAELVIGNHRGTLQIGSEPSGAGQTVTLRGQFKSADGGQVLAQVFGTAPMTGQMTGEFDLTGGGATLRDVVSTAAGHGQLALSEGMMLADLAAIRKFCRDMPSDAARQGWSAFAASSEFNNFAVQWQLRNGTLLVDQAAVRSAGLAASAHGRIGLAMADVNLQVQVGPTPAGGTPSRTGAPVAVTGDALSIQGPWDRPTISKPEPALLP